MLMKPANEGNCVISHQSSSLLFNEINRGLLLWWLLAHVHDGSKRDTAHIYTEVTYANEGDGVGAQ